MSVYFRLSEAISAVKSYSDIVVRTENTSNPERSFSSYKVFDDPKSLLEVVQRAPEGVSFHEITRVDTDPFVPNQKLYFDIDLPMKNWGTWSGKDIENEVILKVTSAVTSWFIKAAEPQHHYRIQHPMIMTSSDYTSKISLHILYPLVEFRSHHALKRAGIQIRAAVEPWVSASIDVLYKKNQGLRLLWAKKDTRQKIIKYVPWLGTDLEMFCASLVHNYGQAPAPIVFDQLCPLDTIGYAATSDAVPCMQILLQNIEYAERQGALARGGTEPPEGGVHMEYGSWRSASGVVQIKLRRKAPSFCIVCDRDHDHENLYIDSFPNGKYYLRCRRQENEGVAKSRKKILIYTDTQTAEEYRKKNLESQSQECQPMESVVLGGQDYVPSGETPIDQITLDDDSVVDFFQCQYVRPERAEKITFTDDEQIEVVSPIQMVSITFA